MSRDREERNDGRGINASLASLANRFHHDDIAMGRANDTHRNRRAIANISAPGLVALDDLDDLRIAGIVETHESAVGSHQPKRARGRGYRALRHFTVLRLCGDA